jgi:hypothetical protein
VMAARVMSQKGERGIGMCERNRFERRERVKGVGEVDGGLDRRTAEAALGE